VKQYSVIYADPPWHFSSKELQKYSGERFTPLDKHYTTQSDSWIRCLPVKGVCTKNAALFLWATDAHIPIAIEVMTAWGFKYVTIAFVWEKLTSTGKTTKTLGAWTLKSYEMCLLGTRGGMLQYKASNTVLQQVRAERTCHSRKPEEVRNRIEQLFPNLPHIELFARQRTPGWDAWGNEVESDIVL